VVSAGVETVLLCGSRCKGWSRISRAAGGGSLFPEKPSVAFRGVTAGKGFAHLSRRNQVTSFLRRNDLGSVKLALGELRLRESNCRPPLATELPRRERQPCRKWSRRAAPVDGSARAVQTADHPPTAGSGLSAEVAQPVVSQCAVLRPKRQICLQNRGETLANTTGTKT